MPDIKKCDRCDGNGGYTYLISMHDDVTGYTKCAKCNGKGTLVYMTEDEERDYRQNNG